MEHPAEDSVNYRTRTASRLPNRKRDKSCAGKALPLFEIAGVFVHLDDVASMIVNANPGMM